MGEHALALYPSYPVHDRATAKIVVEEAGGKVTNIFGKAQRYDGRADG